MRTVLYRAVAAVDIFDRLGHLFGGASFVLARAQLWREHRIIVTADTTFSRRQVKAIAFARLLECGVPVFFPSAQAAGVYKALYASEPQQGFGISRGIAEWPIGEDHSSTSGPDAIENELEDKQEIELQLPVVGQVFV
ncbi:hypothetical protein IG631_24014 [Alternaria alternata]|nr:hypothetical protein IG631_24014 [Alternaria alternata]